MPSKVAFSKATITSLDNTPTENGVKSVLVLEARLSYATACRLGIEEMLYNSKEIARPFNNTVSMAKPIRDAEIALPGANEQWSVFQCHFHQPVVWHAKNADDDDLRIEFRAHFNSNHVNLMEFVLENRKADFKFEIRKRQGELFDDAVIEPVPTKAQAAAAKA